MVGIQKRDLVKFICMNLKNQTFEETAFFFNTSSFFAFETPNPFRASSKVEEDFLNVLFCS